MFIDGEMWFENLYMGEKYVMDMFLLFIWFFGLSGSYFEMVGYIIFRRVSEGSFLCAELYFKLWGMIGLCSYVNKVEGLISFEIIIFMYFKGKFNDVVDEVIEKREFVRSFWRFVFLKLFKVLRVVMCLFNGFIDSYCFWGEFF